jgi:hypothetical protein
MAANRGGSRSSVYQNFVSPSILVAQTIRARTRPGKIFLLLLLAVDAYLQKSR